MTIVGVVISVGHWECAIVWSDDDVWYTGLATTAIEVP